MKSNWDFSIKELLKSEGGYTNDPSDSGGPTNFGITIYDYRKYINANGQANDVKNMTVDQAKSIYKAKYWNALKCDDLESGVDYTCFDYGVLAGLGRPRADLQKFKDLKGIALIDAINNERAAFLRGLAARRPKDQKFLKGWMNRVDRVRAQSKVLAGKKDVVAGPIGGAVAGLSLWTMFTNYIHAHPYTSVIAAVALGALVWWVITSLRNKKWNLSEISSKRTSTPKPTHGGSTPFGNQAGQDSSVSSTAFLQP